MSANPYDLRAGLLSQAQDVLNNQYHSNLDMIIRCIDLGITDPKTITWPVPPTSEDIIEEATKLYVFVQTK